MKWILDLFSSTLGRKLLMACTGLFLILFLLVHLIGNLQLMHDDQGRAFNRYAEFMGTNPLIQLISKGNFFFIALHIFISLLLTIRNRGARGPAGYKVNSGKSSVWSSRNMGILGTLVLIFLVVHLRHFWANQHFGDMAMATYDGVAYKDLYALVNYWFHKEWYVALYVFCMIALSFHLWHGFWSVFQTFGMNHSKYNPLILFVGRSFALIVPALFALIPLWMYFML